ncbi:MAG: heavy-metal-associated domain-containing protein [Prevotellaceae bacterium]|jgi:copper chaperone CopZ|nr:heavy-metal-associated domain-containing protein [Prevotellaceae bacterium]
MKNLKLALLALTTMFGATTLNAALKAGEAEVTFKTTIHCDHCKARLERSIPYEKGVEDMDVKLSDKTVSIKYKVAKTSVENLKKAIEKLGYEAEVIAEKKAEDKK